MTQCRGPSTNRPAPLAPAKERVKKPGLPGITLAVRAHAVAGTGCAYPAGVGAAGDAGAFAEPARGQPTGVMVTSWPPVWLPALRSTPLTGATSE